MSSRTPPIDRWGFSGLARAARPLSAFLTPQLDGVNDAEISVGGRKLVNLAGIGILGWQHDPQVRRVFADTAATYGLVVGGSRMAQGISRPHRDLEALMCRITGRTGALTFATAMLANVGFVQAMTTLFSVAGTEVDNTGTVLVLDRDSHWSMWKAAERLRPGSTLLAFRHNDPADLRRVLERTRGRKVVVGFETVYSADGSVAPVGEILDLCDDFGAVSFADDANGFMVYGNGGPRFAAEYEQLRRCTFVAVSFGKGVGLSGGALTGPAEAIEAFTYLSGTSMFTTNLQPPTAGAIGWVLRRMLAQPSVMERYLDRVDDLRDQLVRSGATIGPVPTHIVSIHVGADDIAARVRADFLERGYLVPVFRYPAVPRDRSLIRLMLNDRLSPAQVEGFVETLGDLRRIHGF